MMMMMMMTRMLRRRPSLPFRGATLRSCTVVHPILTQPSSTTTKLNGIPNFPSTLPLPSSIRLFSTLSAPSQISPEETDEHEILKLLMIWDIENKKLSKKLTLADVYHAMQIISQRKGIKFLPSLHSIEVFGWEGQITEQMKQDFKQLPGFTYNPTKKGANEADKAAIEKIREWKNRIEEKNIKNALVIIISNDYDFAGIVLELIRDGHRVVIIYTEQREKKETKVSVLSKLIAVFNKVPLQDLVPSEDTYEWPKIRQL